MFNSTLATEEDEITIPDVEPAAFLALLKFLYSDEVQIGPETVMTTLYTAKKYAVPALEKHCVDFLKRNLSPDNAFMLLTQARLFDEPQVCDASPCQNQSSSSLYSSPLSVWSALIRTPLRPSQPMASPTSTSTLSPPS